MLKKIALGQEEDLLIRSTSQEAGSWEVVFLACLTFECHKAPRRAYLQVNTQRIGDVKKEKESVEGGRGRESFD